jgi:ribosomal protein S20
MESIIVHPENKEQLSVVKAFLKALKISFEKKETENYNSEFVQMIKEAERNGDYKTIDPNNLWESIQSK